MPNKKLKLISICLILAASLCCSIAAADNDSALKPATYDFSCTPTSAVLGQSITCTDLTSAPATGWTWYWGDNTANYSVGRSIEHTFTAPGKYYVILRVASPTNLTVIRKMGYITITAPVPTQVPLPIPTEIPVLYNIELVQYIGDLIVANNSFLSSQRPEYYTLMSEEANGTEIHRAPLEQNATRYEIRVSIVELVDNV